MRTEWIPARLEQDGATATVTPIEGELCLGPGDEAHVLVAPNPIIEVRRAGWLRRHWTILRARMRGTEGAELEVTADIVPAPPEGR